MNITDKLIEDMGRRMAEEIDRKFLWDMFIETGWTQVTIRQNYNLEINMWLVDNCKGHYEWHDRDFIFQNKKDATMFILRWV